MIELNTRFTPFRLRLKVREAVQLYVEVINTGDKEKMLTLDIMLPNQLSFDKGGYRTAQTYRIEALKPRETKRYYLDIWPKPNLRMEEQPVVVKAIEHYKNFSYVENTQIKKLMLQVEE